MEKVYSGACMALPEKDEELFAMINAKTAQRRQQREAEESIYFDNAYADPEWEPVEQSRMIDLNRALPWVAAVAAMLAGMLLGRLM